MICTSITRAQRIDERANSKFQTRPKRDLPFQKRQLLFERERVDVTKILFDSDVQRGIHLVEGAALDGQIEVYTDRFPMVFAAFRVTVDYMLSHSFLLTKEALTRKASTSFFNRKWPFKIQLHYRVKVTRIAGITIPGVALTGVGRAASQRRALPVPA